MTYQEKAFIPTTKGDEVARTIHEKPETTEQQIGKFCCQLIAYYQDTGMAHHNPERAYKYTILNLLRVARAPLLHRVEEELARTIHAKQKAGQAIVSPYNLAETRFDAFLTRKGERTYAGRKLSFLRASSTLSHAAATRFIDATLRHENKYAPILDAFCKLEEKMIPMVGPQRFLLSEEPYERLKDLVVAANVTTLDVLVPAGEHLRPHMSTADIPTAILQRSADISWAASSKNLFFRRHIGHQNEDAKPPEACPFTHDAEAIALGGIWSVRSLLKPWPVPGYCPENIPLHSEMLGAYVTGAQLRLTSLTHVARETLWAK